MGLREFAREKTKGRKRKEKPRNVFGERDVYEQFQTFFAASVTPQTSLEYFFF